MTIFDSLILGIVEGITEFLPVSSTGHLILTSYLLKINQLEFTKSFEIIIQFGAILAVIFLYWRFLFNIENLKKIILGFIPTGIIGLTLYKILKENFLGNQNIVLWALFLGGIFIIVFEYLHKEKIDDLNQELENPLESISYKQSFFIGIFQSIAIIPGVSRSASTIIGGLILGLKRKTIVEFSFLLAIPTILGASGLDLLKNFNQFSKDQFGILAFGFIVSFITAILSIKLLLGFIKKYSFKTFGIYRVLLAILFWIFVLR